MPGAFYFEGTHHGSLSGVNPGMFRPPISPSSSDSLCLGRSSGTLYSDTSTPISNAKRKRHRPNPSTPLRSWAMPTYDAGLTDDAREDKSETDKWSGEGEGRYVLAGQIATPDGVAPSDIQDAMDDSIYSDIDYRRVLASRRPHSEIESSNYNLSDRAIPPSPQTRRNGWGSLALSTIGGVVGKVFEFCKSGMFRGFYAGGGKGYEMNAPAIQQTPTSGQVWCNEHDIPTLPSFDATTTMNSLPQSDYSPYHYEQETPESTPPPAAKRRQIYEGALNTDELRKNWVMVQEPAEKTRPQSRASRAPTSHVPEQQTLKPLPHRRISRPISRVSNRTSTPSFVRRQGSRVTPTGSISLSNYEPASFASPRPHSPSPSHITSRIPVPSCPQTPIRISPARPLHQPSLIPTPSSTQPKRSHRRNHSNASAASMTPGRVRRGESSIHEFEDNSPRLDAEAKNLAAKMYQEEMEADMRMSDLNARLMDMIRQGKEALGTTIEVEAGNHNGGMDPWEDA